jgi:hypothetical protein
MLNVGFLQQNDDKWTGLVSNPNNIMTVLFGAAMDHIHMGVFLIEGNTGVDIGNGKGNVG